MKFWFVIAIIISPFITCVCHGEYKKEPHTIDRKHNEKDISEIYKKVLVREIIRKVSNFTLDSLINASPEKKSNVLKKIREKLQNTATDLDPNGKIYAEIILQLVKIYAFNNTAATNKHNINLSKHINITKEKQPYKQETRDVQLKSIKNKIENLTRESLRIAKALEDRKKVLEDIKKRIEESAETKQKLILQMENKLKNKSDLIKKEIEVMMQKIKLNTTRRMNIEFIGNKREIADINEVKTELPSLAEHSSALREKKENENSYENLEDTTIYNTNFDDSTIEFETCGCNCEINKTCSSLQELRQFTCVYIKTVIPLEKLCNGIIDCPDKSDEKHCTKLVIERLRLSSKITSDTEKKLSTNCFKQNADSSLLMKHHAILKDVLKNQMKFIEKYTNTPSFKKTNLNAKLDDFKKSMNEIILVINTFTLALEGAICTPSLSENIGDSRKYSDILNDDLEQDIPEAFFTSIKSCSCKAQFCNDKNCNHACKIVCWHKHSLRNWNCRAINGSASVSLDAICDGKFDCYDETDESGCGKDSFAKFEASNIYDDIIKSLRTKSASKEYTPARNQLNSLYTNVKTLQKLTTKRNNLEDIKVIREQCFSTFPLIYNQMLTKAATINDANIIYERLLSLNEKLVAALKRSHTGNVKILSPDDCLCRNSSCVTSRCSNKCVRACQVEPKLTRYFCNHSSTSNNSVSIDEICNGKRNCPNGDDESNCKIEVCRGHHLKLLRLSLQDVGKNQSGTALGEMFKLWRTKVVATLKVAEQNGRPTPNIFKDIISHILGDLVTTYASIDTRRNNDEYIMKEFLKISHHILQTIKSCGK